MRKLEQKYANELMVVGVHSAKFPNEKIKDNLQKAVQRYELGHPVVNDVDFQVWQQYACRAWPTLMFIDPLGKVIGKHEGELAYDQFDDLIGQMVTEFDGLGLLNRKPVEFVKDAQPQSTLSFPGKVVADADSNRLYISDSNRNRIVVATLDGTVLRVVGSGEPGMTDGNFSTATFNHPQGMALVGDLLYVADAENHAIREVDLIAGQVETIAGTGNQGHMREGSGPGAQTDLNSPWDLASHDGSLYIAMAGMHQLWSMDLSTSIVGPYAGSGRESLDDGPLGSATLAQPSGITTDGNRLYFADSETSAVRSSDLPPNGRLRTIVGLGLFEFGDVDGADHSIRLQHPIGVAHHEGTIYVADTYNHKIKRVLPVTRSCFTMLGTGEAGHRDGPGDQALFSEPSGLSIAAGKMYIADTNNHAIRVANLESGEVSTLDLSGI